MSATVGRGGVIGRSLGLRSAINHSQGSMASLLSFSRVLLSLKGPKVQVPRSLEGSLSPKDLVDLSANPISGTESCVATQPRYFSTLRSGCLTFFPSGFHISSSNRGIPRSIERFHPRLLSLSLSLSCPYINRHVIFIPVNPRSVSRTINCRYEF